jgi:E1A-binding protein p400
MSIDELLAKYKPGASKPQDSDDDSSEDETSVDGNSEDESMDVDSDDETADQEMKETQEAEVGLENLLDDQAGSSGTSNCDNGDALLNNVAALAQSIQPKGNTLSSTQVVTPIPILLRHTLREYQHIGLDWLVTMHDRKLNGILADEMGKKLFNIFNYKNLLLN